MFFFFIKIKKYILYKLRKENNVIIIPILIIRNHLENEILVFLVSCFFKLFLGIT